MRKKKRPTAYQIERQRFRNTQRRILNLEERVKAIQLYDSNPVYMRVAIAFKCSWEQIKNCIQNRDSILSYYSRCQTVGVNDNPSMVRQKKINFLGKVMYEWVRRTHYYRLGVINNNTVREKALVFRNILQIDSFSPNKAWVTDFKTAYNLDFEELNALVFTQKPPMSVECVDIVVYCSKELENMQRILKERDTLGENVEPPTDHIGDLNDCSNSVIDVGSEDSKDAEFDEDNNEEAEEDDLFEADEDWIADFDDINENEEGPTIDYGDYDYHSDDEDSQIVILEQKQSSKEEANKDRKNEETQMITRAQQMSVDEKTPQVLAEKQSSSTTQESLKATNESSQKSSKNSKYSSKNKQESPKPSEPQITEVKSNGAVKGATYKEGTILDSSVKASELQITEVKSNGAVNGATCTKGSILDSSVKASLHTSLLKHKYAAALEILEPLEEFAFMEENFHAINLLSQLYETFSKGKRRKIEDGPT